MWWTMGWVTVQCWLSHPRAASSRPATSPLTPSFPSVHWQVRVHNWYWTRWISVLLWFLLQSRSLVMFSFPRSHPAEPGGRLRLTSACTEAVTSLCCHFCVSNARERWGFVNEQAIVLNTFCCRGRVVLLWRPHSMSWARDACVMFPTHCQTDQ